VLVLRAGLDGRTPRSRSATGRALGLRPGGVAALERQGLTRLRGFARDGCGSAGSAGAAGGAAGAAGGIAGAAGSGGLGATGAPGAAAFGSRAGGELAATRTGTLLGPATAVLATTPARDADGGVAGASGSGSAGSSAADAERGILPSLPLIPDGEGRTLVEILLLVLVVVAGGAGLWLAARLDVRRELRRG
jgi:hypothetical protein